ncbi:hypothetical protein [Streptomyces sp. TS71-3]|uniref:hypothetical protein n=1 Tax=Streptomyces sp. TS71-3 TaxID=2733862 RepID=UPI001AFE81DA|nr:hypothetical protein [Streptomyces sp. TS71-3]GHJ37331.1 hypothetical protein Sm713_29400 [Streptomyces sp. TS71-3]
MSTDELPAISPWIPRAGALLPATARAFLRRYGVPLCALAVTAPLYAVWAGFLATGGGDLAAQLAWARFAAQAPSSAYNLFWYAGMHTANYSLISPYLMAAAGVRTVSVAAGLASSWLAGLLMVRTGMARPLWPALLAAVCLWCDVVSGRTTFALGTAFALAACLVLAGGTARPGLAALWAGLATMASPVAGLFLAVAGGAWLLCRDWSRALPLLLPPSMVVATTTLLFPFQGEQPMPADRIWQPAGLALATALLAPRSWRVLRCASVVYAAGVVLVYLVPSPIGTNVERLAELAAPAALLACLLNLAPARRRALLLVPLALSSLWLAQKTQDDISVSTTVPPWAAHTSGVIRELGHLRADRTRVEVVPARNHREADLLSAHVDTARGWNRQLDVVRGRLFYRPDPSTAAYRAWLDHWAVGLVVLPHGQPDGPAEREAALVRSHPGWLTRVWHDPYWSVYRVEDAVPLVSGAAATTVTSDASHLTVRAGHKGSITVRVVYSRWLHANGGACVRATGDWVRLVVPAPGEYRIGSEYRFPWQNACEQAEATGTPTR